MYFYLLARLFGYTCHGVFLMCVLVTQRGSGTSECWLYRSSTPNVLGFVFLALSLMHYLCCFLFTQFSLEPSNDMRANFKHLLSSEDKGVGVQGVFRQELSGMGVPWKQLLFSMCLLHSVLQARCTSHKQAGWNASYHFIGGDFAVSDWRWCLPTDATVML